MAEDDEVLQEPEFNDSPPWERLSILRSEGLRRLSAIKADAFLLQYDLADLNIADVEAASKINARLRQIQDAAEKYLKLVAELTSGK